MTLLYYIKRRSSFLKKLAGFIFGLLEFFGAFSEHAHEPFLIIQTTKVLLCSIQFVIISLFYLHVMAILRSIYDLLNLDAKSNGTTNWNCITLSCGIFIWGWNWQCFYFECSREKHCNISPLVSTITPFPKHKRLFQLMEL